MAEIAGIWDDVIDKHLHPEDCILAFGDSTTAMGWIHKSKYRANEDSNESAEARLSVARQLADLILDNDLKLYSQWFAGAKNEAADFLSREGGVLTDEQLTHSLISNFNQQVPRNCSISVLKPEIISFFSATLQRLPKRQQQPHNIRDLAVPPGKSGKISSNPSNSSMTHSWNNLDKMNETNSSPYSHNSSDPDLHQREEFQNWLKAQSEIPLAQWHRRSWKTTYLTHDCQQMEKQH
jgi:hypothetical protein